MSRYPAVLTALFLSLTAVAAPAWARAPTVASAATPAVFQSSRIVVETRGQGPDVVLIPGLASTSAVWSRTAAALQDRYRVHLITARGSGPLTAARSAGGRIGGPAAAEILRYIDEAGLDRPAPIGHTTGGQMALRVAAEGGPRVGRVMVVDASPFFPSLISPGSTVGDVEPLARLAYQGLMLL